MKAKIETKLAPGFLAASPQIKDPFFKKALIFLLEHNDRDGAFGLIVNKPLTINMGDIFTDLQMTSLPVLKESARMPVYNGGPVIPEAGWVIHDKSVTYEETKIFNTVAVTASKQIIEDFFNGKGPGKYIFCLGYSGWDRGQLIEEIKVGTWLHVPFDETLIFNTSVENRWNKAIESLGIDPAFLSSVQEDSPAVN